MDAFSTFPLGRVLSQFVKQHLMPNLAVRFDQFFGNLKGAWLVGSSCHFISPIGGIVGHAGRLDRREAAEVALPTLLAGPCAHYRLRLAGVGHDPDRHPLAPAFRAFELVSQIPMHDAVVRSQPLCKFLQVQPLPMRAVPRIAIN